MIKLYNVLTRKKQIFKPLKKGRVGFYACGPTVYNFAHIGNLRTYIFEDVLHRALKFFGYRVQHVMNITDVDDKIIRDAAKAKQTIFKFVDPYEKAFFEDLGKLNILPAWKYPRATRHIPEMIRLIGRLLKNGVAYRADGSIYFGIKKFRGYGKLSRIHSRELKVGARVEADEYGKQNVQDFVLWKGKKEGEPSWPSPFGDGRPGWHIECSAMSMKYLGATFDIHAGGVDLIFPHHENEIAQSEGATGKPFVRYVVEGEHLLVNGEKMSKSLGNVFTLRDLEDRSVSPFAFRYLVLTAHYRTKLNFSWESLRAAEQSLKHLRGFFQEIKKNVRSSSRKISRVQSIGQYKKKFERALADDIDTPRALALLWRLARDYRARKESFDPRKILKFMLEADRVLGLALQDVGLAVIPPTIIVLAEERETWRKVKDWKKADKIRQKIYDAGYLIEDTPQGPQINPVRNKMP